MARREGAAWLRHIHAAATGADAVLGSSLTWSPALVAARGLGALAVGAGFQPTLPTREFAPPLLGRRLPAPLNRTAGRLLLAGLHASAWASLRGEAARLGAPPPSAAPPDLVLGAWSPRLVRTPADWPEDALIVTGAWHDIVTEPAVPGDLAAFLAGGAPPVYVGLGSLGTWAGAQALTTPIVEALTGAGPG